MADQSMSAEGKADNRRAAWIVSFVSTGWSDSAAKKQFAGRVIQQRVPGALDAESEGFHAFLIANNVDAGHNRSRFPQIPFFPTGRQSIRNRKNENHGELVPGL